MTADPRPDPRGGFTLVEVMVVLLLSAVVTMGIVTFYLSAQQIWTDSSSQALAQRDATTILESMASKTHAADTALVEPSDTDPANSLVVLYERGPGGIKLETARFYRGTDMLLHEGDQDLRDIGPITASQVMRFHATYVDTLKMLVVDSLRVRSSNGQQVTQSSAFGLYN